MGNSVHEKGPALLESGSLFDISGVMGTASVFVVIFVGIVERFQILQRFLALFGGQAQYFAANQPLCLSTSVRRNL